MLSNLSSRQKEEDNEYHSSFYLLDILFNISTRVVLLTAVLYTRSLTRALTVHRALLFPCNIRSNPDRNGQYYSISVSRFQAHSHTHTHTHTHTHILSVFLSLFLSHRPVLSDVWQQVTLWLLTGITWITHYLEKLRIELLTSVEESIGCVMMCHQNHQQQLSGSKY